MSSGVRNAKTNCKTVTTLVTALLACMLLLVFLPAAHADEPDSTASSTGLTLRSGGTIYVNGNSLENVINGIPDGESRTIHVTAGRYSGFTIRKNVDVTLIPDGGNVVFDAKPIVVSGGASLALKDDTNSYFIVEKLANDSTVISVDSGSTLNLDHCLVKGPIQANNAYLKMRMCHVDDPYSPLLGGRPNGSIGLFNSAHATIDACTVLGTIVVSDSVIEMMENVTVNSQMGKGAPSLTVKNKGRVERIFSGTLLGNPNVISLQNGSIGSIENTTMYVSFDDAKASAILLKGPSNIGLVKGCKISAKRAFEFGTRISGGATAPKVGAVEGSTLRCNDMSIASTADAQAKVVLEPSLVRSGKAIGEGNYHDKHGEYAEWIAVSAPKGYRLSRMTRSLTASGELDQFADVGYRYFVATDCTLTFDLNGGEGDMSAYNLPQGSEEVWADLPYTIPKCNFTYGGHKFKAWNTKPDGSGMSFLPGSNVFIFKTLNQKNVTLYAIYEGTLATVTFDYGGDSGLMRQNVWVGKTVTQPENPQRDHYDFGGWYTDTACTKPFDFKTVINGDLTLYAKWKNFSSHHNWIVESQEGEVSCVSGMHVTYRCTLCGETKVEYTPKDLSMHRNVDELTNQDRHEPTCTQDGYYCDVKKCRDCGYVLYRDWTTLSRTGHSWGEWVVIQDSTESVAGVQRHTCTKCGATEDRPYPTKLHDHTFMKIEEEQSTCERQGHKEYWYCAGCGEWFLWHNDHYREVGPDDNVVYALADHTRGYPVSENRVEPTCGEDGSYDEVVYCSVCRQDEGQKQELSRERKTIPATGQHTEGIPVTENIEASTCTKHGSHDVVTYCTKCKQEVYREHVDDDLLPHTPGEPVRENVVDPTATEDGWYDEVVYCTVCKHELSRKEIALPAHGASYSITEGDGDEWSSDDDGGLTQVFKRSKDDETTIDHFLAIRIDDAEELLDSSCYEVEKGSVIITFAPDYLDTLEVGEHTVTVLFDDGDEVNASFTILEPKPYDEEDDPVQPGEEGSGDPVQPGEEGSVEPVQPGEEGAGDPVQPGEEGTGDPVQPGEEKAGDLVQPGEEGKGDPVQPGEEGKGDPVQPGEEGTGDPVQPGEEKAGDPVQPGGAKTPATKPASSASAGSNATPKTGDDQRAGAVLLASVFASIATACVAWRKRRNSR